MSPVDSQPQSPTPWEPPLAGTEAEHLLGMLDRLHWTFRWKADGLDATGLSTTIGRSSLTLGGLLKHLAGVEAVHLTWKAFGEDPGDPWRSIDWSTTPDWSFTSAADDSPAELYALYDSTVERMHRRLSVAIADGGLDQLTQAADDDGNRASLRRLVCDLIEEYGRHAGHADLLREAVDGRVGEDPPSGWRPVSTAS